MNISIFNFFHNLSSFGIVGDAAILLHRFTYGVIFLILIWVIVFAKRKFFTFSLLFLSGISSWLVAHTLKILFHTARPFIELGFTPLVYEGNFSFPSEHSAVFSAIAVSMFLINKRFAIVLSIVALIIGISRMVLGVHYPVDVLGGFIIGCAIGYMYTKLFKKL